MAVELWGLFDGLMLTKNLNIRYLIVEVDAMAIVKILSSSNASFESTHPYSAIIIDCRSLFQDFEDAQVDYIHREGNRCADILAKKGDLVTVNFSIHSHPPSSILY